GQPQVGLVNEGGGLEGLAGFLLRDPLGRESAQLVVDEREHFGRSLGVAGRGGIQQASEVRHGIKDTRTRWCHNSKTDRGTAASMRYFFRQPRNRTTHGGCPQPPSTGDTIATGDAMNTTKTYLGLESLDRRDMPSTVTLSSGVLTIDGTADRDHVSVMYGL